MTGHQSGSGTFGVPCPFSRISNLVSVNLCFPERSAAPARANLNRHEFNPVVSSIMSKQVEILDNFTIFFLLANTDNQGVNDDIEEDQFFRK